MKKMRAVYQDERGATYSCPVVLNENTWMLQTSEGLQPITFYFDDDIGGRLTFVEYRKEPPAEDSRLHINRMVGESSFGALQRAYAEQKLAVERKHREAGRAEINNQPADPHKVQAARELNAQILHQRRPRGPGVGLVIENK